jgi:ubiquitin C-terminal hydrolase
MITLDDCLQSFINWENLDNKEMFNCKRCKKLQPADKKLDIWKLPPCLVRQLHLRRAVGRASISKKSLLLPL